MAKPDEFAKNMTAYAQIVGKNASLLVRPPALAIDQAVVLATPVDTGRARANWLVSVDRLLDNTIEPYAPGKDGNTGGQNAQAAIDQGQEAVAMYQETSKSIHITNNLEYIGALNNGSSAQAPANFVQQAIDAGVRAVSKFQLLRKRTRFDGH